MKHTVSIEHCLQSLGYAVVPISGTSMWPLLKQGKSRVQLAAAEGKQLKKGDIVLYQRNDGALILHRIIKAAEKDMFILCGDHRWKPEEQIHRDQILAVAQGFFIDGCYIDDNTWWYRLYKIIWNRNLTVRRCCLALLRLIGLEKKA